MILLLSKIKIMHFSRHNSPCNRCVVCLATDSKKKYAIGKRKSSDIGQNE